jgi:hypothetical protein
VEEIKRQQDGPASSEIGLLCVVFLDYIHLRLDMRMCLEWMPTFPDLTMTILSNVFSRLVIHPNVIPNDPNISQPISI